MLAAMATGTKHLRSTHNFSVFTHQRVLCFALHSLLHFAFSFLWAALVFELKRTWFTEKNSFECSHDDRWSVREQWIGNDCYYYYSDYVCGLKPLKSILFRRIADCDLKERNTQRKPLHAHAQRFATLYFVCYSWRWHLILFHSQRASLEDKWKSNNKSKKNAR